MKIERLASGNYRTRITVNRDGERKVVSVTAPTKAEVARRADLMKGKSWVLMTVEEACERFLELRGPELSPSTLRGYKFTMQMIRKDVIGAVRLEKLNTAMIQKWVNAMDLSKKTKKNHLGFLLSALRFNEVDKVFRVRIADEMKEELYTPTIDEVNTLLQMAEGELYLAICFACFGLRRGEIIALRGEDIDKKRMVVKVNKAYAKTFSGEYVLKSPKTRKSIREVEIPYQIAKMVPDKGAIFHTSPDAITNQFARLVKKAGLPHFRFHDLRSFSASVSLVLGSSKASVKASHGWETDRMLDTRYDRPMRDLLEKDEKKKVLYLQNNLTFKSV